MLALLATLIFIDRTILARHYAATEKQVSDELSQISDKLTFNLYSNIQAIKSLPVVFALNPNLSQQAFTTAAKHVFNDHHQLRNIAAAPDFIIKYMYPIEGNEAAIGLDYRSVPSQFDAVLRVKNERQLVLAGPLELVQGGIAIISRTPVFIEDSAGKESFWGVISAVIDVDELYRQSGIFDAALTIDIAIRGKDSLGKSGEVFYGSPDLFTQQNVGHRVRLPGGSWYAVAKPKLGWEYLPSHIWQQRFYLFSAALLLFLLLLAVLRASMKTATANDKFRTIFSQSPLGIAVIDSLTGQIYDANPAYVQITGRSVETLQNLTWMQITHPDDVQEDADNMAQMNAGETAGFIMQKRYIQPNGSIRWINMTIAPMHVEDTRKPRHLCMTEDISDRKVAEDQLKYMANYDVLTQLPNRVLFADRFSLAVAHTKRTNSMLAICFLDLDNFKPVNDLYGHEAGDQMLIEIAKRIKRSIREDDTVSRQGGDEFALLLSDIDSYEQCEQAIQRIHSMLSLPYAIGDTPYTITASIGATLYPDDDADIDTLLRHADQAMYQAKLTGKNNYQLFNAENDQRTIRKHHQLEELEHALTQQQFQLYYQPKVNMATGKVFGVEALIRWNHPEKGLIQPLDFLPVLEGTTLEIRVGNWVVNEALAQLNRWLAQGIRLEVSVNISSHHLLSNTFIDQLEASLAQYPSINSQYLQLEVLESSALGDLSAISAIIRSSQRTLGVRVALDDFGTGYSSLTHLRNLPTNTIKIDRSFVRDLLDDPSDYSIIDGIIGLADSFNHDVIAEGVETTNHGLILLMMGCEEAQGYSIAKPMSADVFPQWLQDYSPNQQWQHYSETQHSIKENKINLFNLISEHWKETFINNLQSSPNKLDHGPIMNSKQCLCGSWIQRARQERLYSMLELTQLDQAHEALHSLAQSIHTQCQDGNIKAARDHLPAFELAFDKMSNALRRCK